MIWRYIGWTWTSVIVLLVFVIAFCRHFRLIRLLQAISQRKKFVQFSQGVHAAVVEADVGQGKTLLLSILARSITRGKKKVGFMHNIPDADLLSYDDINYDCPVAPEDRYFLAKYYFLDETNFYIEGVSFRENRILHGGVEKFQQVIRHFKGHLWVSATRGNHVWVALRQMVNYYVQPRGLQPLTNFLGFKFATQQVDFYSQRGELRASFNIMISNLDFQLYDSYWLADMAYFRQLKALEPTEGGICQYCLHVGQQELINNKYRKRFR